MPAKKLLPQRSSDKTLALMRCLSVTCTGCGRSHMLTNYIHEYYLGFQDRPPAYHLTCRYCNQTMLLTVTVQALSQHDPLPQTTLDGTLRKGSH